MAVTRFFECTRVDGTKVQISAALVLKVTPRGTGSCIWFTNGDFESVTEAPSAVTTAANV